MMVPSLLFLTGACGLRCGPRMMTMRGGQQPRRSGTEATDLITGATMAGGIAQVRWPQLIELGAKHGPSIAKGQWWRLLTPMALHGSIPHFACNMYALRSMGPSLERVYGPRRTIGVYLIAGCAGNVASTVANFAIPSVGASGAIAGLVGALGVHYTRHQSVLGHDRVRPVLNNIGQVVLANAILGIVTGGIDNWAHLGGFLGGAATGYLIGARYVPVKDRFGRLRYYKDAPLLRFPPLGVDGRFK